MSFRLRVLPLMVNRINKAIPVTDHGGLEGCEVPRLPHFSDKRHADGGEVVSLTSRPPFTPQVSWYSFLLKAESNPEL
jgi:hypothetical protein